MQNNGWSTISISYCSPEPVGDWLLLVRYLALRRFFLVGGGFNWIGSSFRFGGMIGFESLTCHTCHGKLRSYKMDHNIFIADHDITWKYQKQILKLAHSLTTIEESFKRDIRFLKMRPRVTHLYLKISDRNSEEPIFNRGQLLSIVFQSYQINYIYYKTFSFVFKWFYVK